MEQPATDRNQTGTLPPASNQQTATIPPLLPPDSNVGAVSQPEQADSESSGTHWPIWQIGCLLDAATKTTSPVQAAELAVKTLTDRSVSACLRKLSRLLSGACECPEVYRADLTAARLAMMPPPRPEHPKGPMAPQKVVEAWQAFTTITEQYLTLSKQNQRLMDLAYERRAIQIFAVAVGVVTGSVKRHELARFLPTKVALEVNLLADEIFKSRAEHAAQQRRIALLDAGLANDPSTRILAGEPDGHLEKSTDPLVTLPPAPAPPTPPSDGEIEEAAKQETQVKPDQFDQP